MCGRYNLVSDARALVDFFSLDNSLEVRSRYNIAPSQDIPAIRQGPSGRTVALLRWGLIPHWAKEAKIGYRMINARAETVAEKPSFRTAFRRRRCLVPATGFYEWRSVAGGKQPYNICMKDGGLFAFAGLWEQWRGGEEGVVESCTIIVTDANDLIRPVHDRMPVILDPGDYATWLDPGMQDADRLLSLLEPYPAAELQLFPVSKRVGSPANDDPELVSPI